MNLNGSLNNLNGEVKRYLPILKWLPQYKRKNLAPDLIAGLTVGVMLVPQGMAYAMLAGMPLVNGLYAATIPLLIYALFGTSPKVAIGPVALDSMLVSSGLIALAIPVTDHYIELAVLLALMVGVLQVIMGVLQLGFLVNFLSQPVIRGFTSAAALIISLSQLRHLIGVELPRSQFFFSQLPDVWKGLPDTHLPTLWLGLGGIAIIVAIKKIRRSIPGPLIAVVLATVLVYTLDLEEMGISIVGTVPGGPPPFSPPKFSLESFLDLLPTAGTIALVGFMELISIAKSLQARDRDHELDANQELLALGLSNISASFFRAFPVNASFSRSAINADSGSKTPLSSIFTAIFILLTLLFLTPLFYHLPKAILASMIIVSVLGLIEFRAAARLWKMDKLDFFSLLATFAATLSLGIAIGIGVGVGLSLLGVIYRSVKPHIAVMGRLPDTRFYRNVLRFPEAEDRPDILVLRFDAQMYYANIGFFRAKLWEEIHRKGPSLKLVVLNSESIHYLDSMAVTALQEIIAELEAQGIQFYMAAVIGPVRDILTRTGLMEKMGVTMQFMHVYEAVQHWDGEKESAHPAGAQTNESKR